MNIEQEDKNHHHCFKYTCNKLFASTYFEKTTSINYNIESPLIITSKSIKFASIQHEYFLKKTIHNTNYTISVHSSINSINNNKKKLYLKSALKSAVPRKIKFLCLPNERLRCTENQILLVLRYVLFLFFFNVLLKLALIRNIYKTKIHTNRKIKK